MTQEGLPLPQEVHRLRDRVRNSTAILLASTALLMPHGDTDTVSAIEAPAALVATPINFAETLEMYDGVKIKPHCDTISADSIRAADALLSERQNPYFDGGQTGPEAPSTLSELREQKASKYGLHVYDFRDDMPKEYVQAIGSDMYPFSSYLALANKYMNRLGVDVSIATPDQLNSADAERVPTDIELQSNGAKLTLYNMLKAYDGLPQELFALTPLRHIVLAQTDNGGGARTGGGVIQAQLGDPNGLSVNAWRHELEHNIDTGVCGDGEKAANDQAFELLNTLVNPYDSDDLSYLNTYVDLNHMAIAASNAFESGDIEGYCVNEAEIQHVMDETNSFNISPNVVEDKAEIGRNLLDPDGFAVFTNQEQHVLHAKFKLLLARLYEKDWRVATYLSDTSAHATPVDSTRESICS